MWKAVLALGLATSFCACDTRERPDPPERPPELPESAVWIGGWDGGRWHNCTHAGELIECQQWQYGDVSARRTFKLCSKANPSILPAFISGFPLQRVEVKRGSIEMVPTGPSTIYRGEAIDEELTASAMRRYEDDLARKGGEALDCEIELIPRPQE